jgi:hypothetical protein
MVLSRVLLMWARRSPSGSCTSLPDDGSPSGETTEKPESAQTKFYWADVEPNASARKKRGYSVTNPEASTSRSAVNSPPPLS